jgi:hypothetical protein
MLLLLQAFCISRVSQAHCPNSFSDPKRKGLHAIAASAGSEIVWEVLVKTLQRIHGTYLAGAFRQNSHANSHGVGSLGARLLINGLVWDAGLQIL